MSKQDFLVNYRVARKLFAHGKVESDTSGLDPVSLERQISRAAIWLTPKSVEGFNGDDFPELAEDRRRDLEEAIRDFKEVAKDVPATKLATTEQLKRARAAFERARQILEPFVPTHEEVTRTGDALKKVKFPDWVANWDYEFASDADGAPAVRVTIYVDEETATLKQLGRYVSEMSSKIHSALSAARIERWPFLRMRSAAEYKSMV